MAHREPWYPEDQQEINSDVNAIPEKSPEGFIIGENGK